MVSNRLIGSSVIKKCLACLAICSWWLSNQAWGAALLPDLTLAEFNSWPVYCRVVHARSPEEGPRWGKYITPEDTKNANLLIGDLFYGVAGYHHQCAGAIFLARAMVETDQTQRTWFMRNAFQEVKYSYDRSTPAVPLHAATSILMARVFYERGQVKEALGTLDKLISVKPSPDAYNAKALMHHNLGELKHAYDALITGNKYANGDSAEIHYNLGLILLKLQRPQLALEHAKKAYARGFPLPGLKNKLKKAGLWNNQ